MSTREHSSPWKIALTAIVGAPIVAFFYLPWNIFTSWPVVIGGLITLAAAIAALIVYEEHRTPNPELTRAWRRLRGRGRPPVERAPKPEERA